MEDAPENKAAPKRLVRFVNETNRTVWLGLIDRRKVICEVRYTCFLRPGCCSTYTPRMWISAVVYSVDKYDRMAINGKFLYEPEPWKASSTTQIAKIRLPVYSLRYRSLLAVRDAVRNPEEIGLLDLPKQLCDDLRREINLRSHWHNYKSIILYNQTE